MPKVTKSHYVHLQIDGHTGHRRISVPSESFKLAPGELQRLTLLSCELPHTFFRINSSNRFFFFYSPVQVRYYPIAIPEGSYPDFQTLAAVIIIALQDVFSIPDCTYDDVLCRFQLETGANHVAAVGGGAVDVQGYFVSFHNVNRVAAVVAAGGPAAFLPSNQTHQQTHLILGCTPNTRNLDQIADRPTNGFIGNLIARSKLFPRLATLDALLLRSPQQSVAFESMTMSGPLQGAQTPKLAASDIIARIPVSDAPLINYEDPGGDTYQFYPSDTQHLDSLDFALTDEYGRTLAQLLPERARTEPLPIKLVLRWDAIVPDPRTPRGPKGQFSGNYRDVLTEAEQ